MVVPVHLTAPTEIAPAASPGVGMLPSATAIGAEADGAREEVELDRGARLLAHDDPVRAPVGHEAAPVTALIGEAGVLRCTSTQAPAASCRSTATLARDRRASPRRG